MPGFGTALKPIDALSMLTARDGVMVPVESRLTPADFEYFGIADWVCDVEWGLGDARSDDVWVNFIGPGLVDDRPCGWIVDAVGADGEVHNYILGIHEADARGVFAHMIVDGEMVPKYREPMTGEVHCEYQPAGRWIEWLLFQEALGRGRLAGADAGHDQVTVLTRAAARARGWLLSNPLISPNAYTAAERKELGVGGNLRRDAPPNSLEALLGDVPEPVEAAEMMARIDDAMIRIRDTGVLADEFATKTGEMSAEDLQRILRLGHIE